MVATVRTFIKLLYLSAAGIVFYYSHLFFGLFTNVFLFKALAVMFLLVTLPLPVMAFNNKKLFPMLTGAGKKMLNWALVLLFVHHFLMTFIFVMILKESSSF